MLASRQIIYDDRKINLYESPGNGTPVLLIHGNSSSATSFSRQLLGQLGNIYRLLALDLPGHGESEIADRPSCYSLPGYARLVASITKELDLHDMYLVGSSLGGHIALQSAVMIPDIRGIMIIGTAPLNKPLTVEDKFFPSKLIDLIFSPTLSESEAFAWASLLMAPNSSAPLHTLVHDILATDPQARECLGKSIAHAEYLDETEIIAQLSIPIAIVQGAREQIIKQSYIQSLKVPNLWRNKPQIINNAGHFVHFEQPEAFNLMVTEFIESCDRMKI
jgi:pimeloyl-ACP methyl ester carboxylesterase